MSLESRRNGADVNSPAGRLWLQGVVLVDTLDSLLGLVGGCLVFVRSQRRMASEVFITSVSRTIRMLIRGIDAYSDISAARTHFGQRLKTRSRIVGAPTMAFV